MDTIISRCQVISLKDGQVDLSNMSLIENIAHHLFNSQNAIKELEIAYESNEISDKDAISLNLANSYYELGNFSKAREYYGQVLTKENIAK